MKLPRLAMAGYDLVQLLPGRVPREKGPLWPLGPCVGLICPLGEAKKYIPPIIRLYWLLINDIYPL